MYSRKNVGPSWNLGNFALTGYSCEDFARTFYTELPEAVYY